MSSSFERGQHCFEPYFLLCAHPRSRPATLTLLTLFRQPGIASCDSLKSRRGRSSPAECLAGSRGAPRRKQPHKHRNTPMKRIAAYPMLGPAVLKLGAPRLEPAPPCSHSSPELRTEDASIGSCAKPCGLAARPPMRPSSKRQAREAQQEMRRQESWLCVTLTRDVDAELDPWHERATDQGRRFTPSRKRPYCGHSE